MKSSRISSEYVLREIELTAKELTKSAQRISSGKIIVSDSSTGLYLSRALKERVEKLEFVSQHITRAVNTLQKYEDTLDSVVSFIEEMKVIVERASQAGSPEEFREIENAYKERYQSLREFVRKTTFFGKAIASGGYSNAVTKTEVSVGEILIRPPDINVSGINFRKYGIRENEAFLVKISKTGTLIRSELVRGDIVLESEEKDVSAQSFPATVDFEKIGLSVNLPSDGDFSILVYVVAAPFVIVFGDGESDFEEFFFHSLEPDFLGISGDLSDGVEINLGRLTEALQKLGEIRGSVGEKIQKFISRADMNSMIQARNRVLGGIISDTDMPSEATIFSLRQTLLQSNVMSIQRAIEMLSYAVDMLR